MFRVGQQIGSYILIKHLGKNGILHISTILQVSSSLGHNCLDIITRNYLG